MIFYQPAKPAQSIPVIDLTPSFGADPAACDAIAWEIHKACRDTGFFYITGHGIADALLDAQFIAARRFFDLPLAEKMALDMKNSLSTAGYEPIGGQILDSQDDTAEAAPPDLKESFYCGMELPEGHPWAEARLRSYGHNQWPPHLPGFRDQMLAYSAAITTLGDHLMRLLARSLDLPADWFAPFFDMPSFTLRLIKYPPHPANAQANQIGAGAHTDWGGITILAQDDVGGLEVRNAAGEWIEATPIPGTLVINLGDLIARWSNGIYMSNMHRVKNNLAATDRYSIPFFYGPRHSSVIEPIPNCVSDTRPRQFATCTAAEHINEMFRRSYGYAPEPVDA